MHYIGTQWICVNCIVLKIINNFKIVKISRPSSINIILNIINTILYTMKQIKMVLMKFTIYDSFLNQFTNFYDNFFSHI